MDLIPEKDLLQYSILFHPAPAESRRTGSGEDTAIQLAQTSRTEGVFLWESPACLSSLYAL